MRVHYPLGRGQFGLQGVDWQDLCRGPLNIATYKIHAVGLMVSEKKIFLKFFHSGSYVIFIYEP